MNQQTMGCSRKKTNKGEGWWTGWGYISLRKNLEFLSLPLYPDMTAFLEIPEKNGEAFTGNSTKLGDTQKFQGQKPRPMEIPYKFKKEHPCNFHFCYSWPLKSAILIVYGSVAATVFIMLTAICLLTWKPPIHTFLMAGVNLLF